MNAVLGIDTSCDDTGVGIVVDGSVRANVVLAQTGLHAEFGGVVPEQASREHLSAIDHAVTRALEEAGLELSDLTAVAATFGPGLIGPLLVGLSYGKALAWGLGVPFLPVHHLIGHLAAADSAPPFLALLASGGHTVLFQVEAWDRITELGRSRDDAAGEAFDKVARLLGLGYPGGAALADLASSGDDHGVELPWPMKGSSDLSFSFSGLKTAVALLLERSPEVDKADVAATFERVAVGSLIEVTLRAAALTGAKRLVVAGGVAANRRLRVELARTGLEVSFPPPRLATDNGAMIALAAAKVLAGEAPEHPDPLGVDAHPYLPLATA
ncbi:MAG TPA: tRNA (adenosine(37)-N6)-threonylcarbamoyltransferase complex transferase subunit TsaD [Trueperaceae bacterium]|nr:tRNA (adenosine(37)-N6)-threonylcarbamoyltransferase complex transferase subunit TsaD [Trueperaceae bacterium]